MDKELFDLCKQVYEKTGWTNTGSWFNYAHNFDGSWEWVESNTEGGYEHYPIYNSGYLLEKLPRLLQRYGRFELVPTMRNTRWSAGYWSKDRLDTLSAVDYTPLKALLKLTVALHKAGELKEHL